MWEQSVIDLAGARETEAVEADKDGMGWKSNGGG